MDRDLAIVIKKIKFHLIIVEQHLRLLTPLIAGSKVRMTITGDKSLSKRPYRLEFLKQFLMDLKPTNKQYLPIKIKGHENCIQSNVKIVKPSAQMVSAATIAGIISYGETILKHQII